MDASSTYLIQAIIKAAWCSKIYVTFLQTFWIFEVSDKLLSFIYQSEEASNNSKKFGKNDMYVRVRRQFIDVSNGF